MRLPIPCTIITGPLGAGKTTCIQSLIQSKPRHEKWAIVVNEFGAVGIDGALLGASAGQDISVKELAGGCMCCTLSGPFGIGIAQIIRQSKPDRLIIEPSGLGHPAGLLDVLQGEHLRSAVTVKAILCLVKVGSHRSLAESVAFFDQVNIADIIVGNQADLATPEQVEDFKTWGSELWPPKAQILDTSHGQLPEDTSLLDLPRNAVFEPMFAAAHSSGKHRRMQQQQQQHKQGGVEPTAGAELQPGLPLLMSADASKEHVAVGWIFHQDDVFDQQGLMELLSSLSRHVLRLKGVFKVPAGVTKTKFVVVQQAQQDGESLTVEPICYRRESRFEIILHKPSAPSSMRGVAPGAGEGAGEQEDASLEHACRTGDWDKIQGCLKQHLVKK